MPSISTVPRNKLTVVPCTSKPFEYQCELKVPLQFTYEETIPNLNMIYLLVLHKKITFDTRKIFSIRCIIMYRDRINVLVTIYELFLIISKISKSQIYKKSDVLVFKIKLPVTKRSIYSQNSFMSKYERTQTKFVNLQRIGT